MRASLCFIAVAILAWVDFTTSVTTLRSLQEQDSYSTRQQVTQTSLADAPSLRLRVIFKREGMQIHGQSIFDVFATPAVSADNASVRYDGFVTFRERDTEFTYMIVKGAAFVVETSGNDTTASATQSVRCHSPVVPFGEFVPALNTAVPVSSVVDEEEVECSSQQLKVSLGGEDFIICASAGYGVIANSKNMSVAVDYLDDRINITAPALTSRETSCDKVVSPTRVSPTAITLLTGSGVGK